MKFYIAFVLQFVSMFLMAQNTDDYSKSNADKMFKVVKQNGAVFYGKIKSQDAREVLLQTKELGEVFIPRHEISEMRELAPEELSTQGTLKPDEVFSSRYFFTTNGLPIKKGEGYVKWSLTGPDIQFAVGKNMAVGFITTWLGTPLIGSFKYSHKLSENAHLGVGTLLGTGSWLSPRSFLAVPFAALTFGDHQNNLNVSAGYGVVSIDQWFTQGQVSQDALVSLAGTFMLASKVSVVFDSFILPRQGLGFFSPGLRFRAGNTFSFQTGCIFLVEDMTSTPIPFPSFQLFQRF